jgi:uncharacterized protein YkwD
MSVTRLLSVGHWLALAIPLTVLPGLPAQAPNEPKFELTADEKELLKLLNESRAKEKLPPLTANPVLTRVARAHSANMHKQGKMTHDLDGKRVVQRVLAAGYDYRSVGENVGFSDGPVPMAAVHDEWMKSKSHRAHIMAAKYTEVGLGLYRGPKGVTYYTQVFGTPRKKR